MKKIFKFIHRIPLPLSQPALRILQLCTPIILLPLLRLLYEVVHAGALTEAEAHYYGKMLEYPVAGVMLMTGAALLADYIFKRQG